MRKGFTVTLLAVAIAMLGSNAMAEAPTIGAIPDIVIGDEGTGGASESNVFVYPDAIDVLDTSVVTDDVTTNSGLTWSYYAPAGTITINGAATVADDTEAVSPDSSKVVFGPASSNDDPASVDSELNTITFRNEELSPVATGGGFGPYPQPATAGLQGSGETVTLFVSDGDKVDSASMLVYTDNNGVDAISSSVVPPINEYNQNFATDGVDGWSYTLEGSTTQATNGGLCLTVALTGNNTGAWNAPGGIIDLVDNAVYKIRVKMTTSGVTIGATPLWDMIVDSEGTGGAANMYGGDFWFYDNQGSANSIASHTGGEFTMFFTPLRVNVPLWKSTTQGAFIAGDDAFNDMSLRFRVFDWDSSGYGSWGDAGTVCLAEVNVDRYDQSAMTVGSEVFNSNAWYGNKFSSADYSVSNSDATNGHTVWNADGSVTMYNSSATTVDSVIQLMPGTGYAITTGNSVAYQKSWPIPWVSDQVLKVEYTVSAGGDDTKMPAVWMVMLDAPSVEYYAESYSVANGWYMGSAPGPAQAPKTGVQETYVAYFNTANTSAFVPDAGDGTTNFLRPTLNLYTNPLFGSLTTGQTGQVNVHNMKVSTVTAP